MDTKIIKKPIVIGIAVLFLATMGMAILGRNMPAFAVGVTIYVDDDNTTGPWDGTIANPYQNITSGIAHASNGDTVYVYSGTYSENVVVNKSITLTGESKPVIDGMGGIDARGIDIIVNNVTVEGFNITNSHYGIYCNASGFSIIDNVFWYDTYGFYWSIDKINLAEDYTVHASMVESNEFYMNTNYDAVYVYVSLDYNYTGFYDVVIGDITVCNNTFRMDGTTATGIELDGGIYVTDLYGGTVSVGVLNMSENTMYGGDYGIDFYGYLDDVQDVEASVGDVIVNDNVLVNQSSGGIYIDYYDATYWHGNTIGTYGDLIVRGNTITSAYSADGIYISDIGYWEYFDGNASLEVGNVYIEENEIDVGDYGIEFYGYDVGYEMNDNSSLTIGDILVNDNTINSDDYGIYVDCEYFGEYMYGNSSVTMGNIEFCRNVINSGNDGIYIYEFYEFGYDMNDNSSFTMGSILVNDNTINSDDYGIYVDYFEYFGEYMYENSSFTMDNIEFCRNVINSGYEGMYLYEFYSFGYYMYDNSSFTMGSILINDNIINSGDEGIYVDYFEYFGEYMYDSSSFKMGDIQFNDNVIYSDDYGIYVYEFYEFGYDMDGTSSFTMGNIEFNGNIINSTYAGIYVDYFEYFGEYMYENSSFTMGDIEFNNNFINTTDYGIYVDYIEYFGYYMEGSSSFTMGNIEFCGNEINSGYEGIYIYELYEFGYEMDDNASFTMGSILVNDNIINSDDYGIYVYYFDYFGEYMYENSSFTMGDIQFNYNAINSNDTGMYIRNIYNFGDYMDGNSTLTMGNIEFSGNTINSTLDGIYFYQIYDIADGMYGNSTFTMGNFSVNDNVITSADDGIHLDYLETFGITVYDNASFTMGIIEFSHNTISYSDAGMNFTDLENAIIRNNIIQNCSYGIYFLNSTNNLIYHNNFINNTVQAYVTFNYTNAWEDGYPSGGNYWSEYTDVDQYSGPGQNITGSDGIWDNPYIINAYNQDNYPFAGNWTWDVEPPSISDISQDPEIPDDLETVTITVIVTDTESGVYNVTLSYSTDSGETWNNVTMQKTTGDTYQGEIPGLPGGTHVQYKITAYDNAGNPAVEDKAGLYYVYTVIPEFPSAIVLLLLMLFTLITVTWTRKTRRQEASKNN